jgi:hypothetical protein
MAYINLNPEQQLSANSSSRLGDLAATNPGLIDTVSKSLGTSPVSLLLLLAGGAALGWFGNDLVEGARKSVRRAKKSINKRASQFESRDALLPLLLLTLAGGAVYYYVTHKSAAQVTA